MISLAALLNESPFLGYSYAYPHKTAYRSLAPARPLRDVWCDEPRDSLFLYLHVPFCEFRCGFCNLFTLANPDDEWPQRYLRQLRREAEQVRAALPDARFTRLAVGGGTPTFLSVEELQELWAIGTDVMAARGPRAPQEIPTSCEASPATATRDKLQLLRELGVDRLSLGVQTFDNSEAGRLGRPQRRREVELALTAIRETGFPTLNIDLIYGGETQTVASWLDSLRAAIEYQPEELYLYPLYVREQTGLGQRGEPANNSSRDREGVVIRKDLRPLPDGRGSFLHRLDVSTDDERLALYRAGRDFLRGLGYEQQSLRMFSRPSVEMQPVSPVYCCQSDGMIGLGCGARSYTRRLHYSTEFAVRRSGVLGILEDYVSREAGSFGSARHGFVLDADEQRRRFTILSLLQRDGLSRQEYSIRFGSDVLSDLPVLGELEPAGLAVIDDARLRLTDAGLERSDTLGPWLYSERVRHLMEAATCL